MIVLTNGIYGTSVNKSGNITSDETWSADTVRVTGELTVAGGRTLTINPGTRVECQGHYGLNVQGRILAVGTETDSIVFTAADTVTGWKGIRFDSTAETNDTSSLVYCVIMHGNGPDAGLTDESNGGGIFINGSFSETIVHRSSLFFSNNISFISS